MAFSFALLMTGAAPLKAQDKDPVLAKVNGVEIHQSDLAVAEEEAGQLPPMSPDQKQDYLIQFTSDMLLLAKAAEDQKLADSARIQAQARLRRQKTADGSRAAIGWQGGADRRGDAQGL